MLKDAHGKLLALDKTVLDILEAGTILSRQREPALDDRLTFGDQMADRVARLGDSWPFILVFVGVLAAWIGTNVTGLLRPPFHPYPFILLNLMLSCVAPLQAPIIMMGQRRQETKNRLRGENDCRINLKAELEIRQLHEKIHH